MVKKKLKKRVKNLTTAKKSSLRRKNLSLAIVALILNVIILPGLGSLIGGKTKEGIWQLVLFLIGAVLFLFYVGIPILIAAYVWGIVTGIKLIQESE